VPAVRPISACGGGLPHDATSAATTSVKTMDTAGNTDDPLHNGCSQPGEARTTDAGRDQSDVHDGGPLEQ
jgi:hypothetical protein